MNTEGLRGLAAVEDFAIQRPDRTSSAWVRALIQRNSVIVLATTEGDQPWIAPLEYMADEDLNLYFFSTTKARHVQHLEANSAAQSQDQYYQNGRDHCRSCPNQASILL